MFEDASLDYDRDMQQCPNGSAGELKIIAATLDRSVIEKILTRLRLDPQPPSRRPWRSSST